MIDLCQQRGLAYGIVSPPHGLPVHRDHRRSPKDLAAAGATGHPVSMPLHVYKLYTDGMRN
jgi:hypothetical protein